MKTMLFTLIFVHAVSSQTIGTPALRRMLLPSAGTPAHQTPPRGFILNTAGGNPDSLVSIILEFREAPYFIARRSGFAAQTADFYERRFTDLAADLSGLMKGAHRSSVPMAVTRKYYKAFFGAGVTVRSGDLPSLFRLPAVKTVHVDEEVTAFLETSIPQMGAEKAWNEYGVKGAGVVVGIIDSGVDYLHPALGGGLGRGFRITGGYDFVNGDDDPMDDNGHGTHVAGIIGADGADIQGVAPRCSMMAFKVLDVNGRGKESDIIAAIERAVDPNLDGDDADRLDIVNVSLGSETGHPDDAKSTAVDNAVRLGVTFCIAAGNNGRYSPVQGKEENYYYTGMETIASPGTSRLAITVGAVDKSDRLTDFSSKGPTARTFGIKPDLLAPGHEIHSLARGGGLATKSGTSMASPMVAGVAALLKSADRSLAPSEIKSALISSSRDLGLPVMAQGAGRADAYRAFGRRTFSHPASLQFGFDDPSQPVWTSAETLHVSNRHSSPQSYGVSFTGNAPGIRLEAQPQTFALPPGESRDVIVTVSVTNAMVAAADDDIRIFGGAASIAGTRDTLRVPWAFARATQMTLTFSEPDPQFIGWGNEYAITRTYGRYESKIVWNDPTHARVIGAFPGIYNFLVYYPSTQTLVTKERVTHSGASDILLSSDAPAHTITFDAVDNTGRAFPEAGKTLRFLRADLPEAHWFYIHLAPGQRSIRITPTSPDFLFYGIEAAADLAGAKTLFIPNYPPFRGISADVRLTNDPSAYVKQSLRFVFPPGITRAKLYPELISVNSSGGRELFDQLSITGEAVDVTNGTATVDLYLMKPADPSFWSSVKVHVNYSDLSADFADLSTSYFSIVNDSVMTGFPSTRSLASHLSPNGGTLPIGTGPVHILNLSYNNSVGPSIQFDPRFRGPVQETRYTDGREATYSIRNAGGLLLRDGKLTDDRTPFAVPAERYEIAYGARNYFLGGVRGTLSMRNTVDLTKQVPDPPVITMLKLIDARGVPTTNVPHKERLTLQFASKVYAAPMQLPVPESTIVVFRKYGQKQWRTAVVSVVGADVKAQGTLFTADLTPAAAEDTSAFDLKIRVADAYGNASELLLFPAFSIGDWRGGQPTEADPEPHVPYTFGLRQNFPNPFNPLTTISYEIPSAGDAELAVFDLLGRHVATLAHGPHAAGNHAAVFDASRAASGMYVYRLSYGARTAVRKMIVVK